MVILNGFKVDLESMLRLMPGGARGQTGGGGVSPATQLCEDFQ